MRDCGIGKTESFEIEFGEPAVSRIEFEAKRRGMSAESYIRDVITREVGTMPRWSFEIEFDENLAEENGTSVDELHGIVAQVAERNGNIEIGHGAWMASDEEDGVEAQCFTHLELRRNKLVASCVKRWVAREDEEDEIDVAETVLRRRA